eukprot:m.472585 g.472585  ORF g.472585 m.472585 type:complete len:85 (-) comp57112_c0_seq8:960-1214(-)
MLRCREAEDDIPPPPPADQEGELGQPERVDERFSVVYGSEAGEDVSHEIEDDEDDEDDEDAAARRRRQEREERRQANKAFFQSS